MMYYFQEIISFEGEDQMTDAERILDFFKKSGLTEKIQKQRQADLISSVSDHHIDTPHWDYYTEISSLLPLYPEFTQFLKEMGISPISQQIDFCCHVTMMLRLDFDRVLENPKIIYSLFL